MHTEDTLPRKLTDALRLAIEEFNRAEYDRVAQDLEGETVNIWALMSEAVSGHRAAEELLMEYPELDVDVPAITCRHIIESHVPNVIAAAEGLTADSERTSTGMLFADSMMDQAETLVAVHLSRELLPDFEVAAIRCCEMARLSIQVSPSPKVRKYLSRLSRCYLMQLDAECIIIARAVLENAIKDRFDAESQVMPTKMHERLRAAVASGWVSQPEARDAMTVWQRGNKAVHEDIELVRDVRGTIELTLSLASRLYSR